MSFQQLHVHWPESKNQDEERTVSHKKDTESIGRKTEEQLVLACRVVWTVAATQWTKRFMCLAVHTQSRHVII